MMNSKYCSPTNISIEVDRGECDETEAHLQQSPTAETCTRAKLRVSMRKARLSVVSPSYLINVLPSLSCPCVNVILDFIRIHPMEILYYKVISYQSIAWLEGRGTSPWRGETK